MSTDYVRGMVLTFSLIVHLILKQPYEVSVLLSVFNLGANWGRRSLIFQKYERVEYTAT